MSQTITLSKADSKVLAQVFDPESSPNKPEIFVNPSLSPDNQISNPALLANLKAQEKSAIFLIEDFERSKYPTKSKEETYNAAITILNDLIYQHPIYASALNNRAQLRRWRYGDRHLLFNRQSRPEGLAAVQDLQNSMSLASPTRPQDGVSPSQGKLLAQSYTQLAAIYHAAAKDLSEANELATELEKGDIWSRNRFEEEASRLFYLGGLYGNEVAKALAVHTNPHAKLCGSIVKEAMRKEIEGM